MLIAKYLGIMHADAPSKDIVESIYLVSKKTRVYFMKRKTESMGGNNARGRRGNCALDREYNILRSLQPLESLR